MTDQVVQTLATAGAIIALATFILAAVREAHDNASEPGGFAMGFGCGWITIAVALWFAALVVWLLIHVKIA